MGRAATWVLLSAALLAGCGEPSAEDASRPTNPTTTTFDREAEEAAVIEAYLAGVEAFLKAADPPNPDDPQLPEYGSGEHLARTQDLLRSLQADGLSVKPGAASTHSPRVIRLVEHAAVVEDCITDADVKVRTDTGEVVDDRTAVGIYTAKLVKDGGAWRVDDSSFEERPCDA